MPTPQRRPRFGRILEYLVLLVLGLVLARGASGAFSRPGARMLDTGTDPRLLILDLISSQQLARSTKLPHELRFISDPQGVIRGYTIAVKTNYGQPWAVLKIRQFPDGLRVSSSLPRLEFAADGGTPAACRIQFDEPRHHRLVTVAGGSGKLRLTDAGAALE